MAFQENLNASYNILVNVFVFPKSWIRCFSRSGVPCRVLSGLRSVYSAATTLRTR